MGNKPSTIEEAIKQQHLLEAEIRNNNLKPALFDKYKILGEEIAIIKSGFKCENCEETENLTIHHLISRKNKLILPLQKYYAQRRFYKNISLLCNKCHHLIDNGLGFNAKSLKKETIDKIKEQFEIK